MAAYRTFLVGGIGCKFGHVVRGAVRVDCRGRDDELMELRLDVLGGGGRGEGGMTSVIGSVPERRQRALAGAGIHVQPAHPHVFEEPLAKALLPCPCRLVPSFRAPAKALRMRRSGQADTEWTRDGSCICRGGSGSYVHCISAQVDGGDDFLLRGGGGGGGGGDAHQCMLRGCRGGVGQSAAGRAVAEDDAYQTHRARTSSICTSFLKRSGNSGCGTVNSCASAAAAGEGLLVAAMFPCREDRQSRAMSSI